MATRPRKCSSLRHSWVQGVPSHADRVRYRSTVLVPPSDE